MGGFAVTDTERLLSASIQLIQKDQVIAALLDENAQLKAQIRFMRSETFADFPEGTPALCRPQAE